MQKRNQLRLAYISAVGAVALASVLADPDGFSALSAAPIVLTLPTSVVLSPVLFAVVGIASAVLAPAVDALGISDDGVIAVLSVLSAVMAAFLNTLVVGLLFRGARRCRLRHARRGAVGT